MIGHVAVIYIEAQDQVSLTGQRNIVGWRQRPLSVGLEQPVFQENGLSPELAEINNHIHAFSHANPDAFRGRHLGHDVSIIAKHPKDIVSTQVAGIRQEELVESRRATVQPPETIAARLHLEEWLDLAVNQESVTQNAIKIESIEKQLSIH